MKKRIEKLNLILAGLMLTATTALQSCSDDDDTDYSMVYPNALVTVKPDADGKSFRMQLNDSTQLWPVNMRQSPFGKKEVRALVNYRQATAAELDKGGIYADMGQVYVNWIDSILTKPMVESFANAEENQKKYGSDPLEIVNDWVTVAEDGYLTLRFRTRWGGGVKHTVNLVHRTDVNTPYYFTLYHDAKGDVNGQVGDALVAFRLADGIVPQEHRGMETLTLEWKSYTGMKTAHFKFRTDRLSSYGTPDLSRSLEKGIE